MPARLDGIVWLIASLVPLIFLQRSLHREIQTVFFLLTRRKDLSITFFSLSFFPGVLMHEGSHFLMARLVGVRTGGFSLIPRPTGDGKLQLGYMETASTDWARDALIGSAPLLVGGAFVAYAGLIRLQLLEMGQTIRLQGWSGFGQVFQEWMVSPDFWLWFYLALVVSSTMLPSSSDRRAWLPIGLVIAALTGLAVVLGAGPWMVEKLAEPFSQVLRAIALVFFISAGLHLLLLPFVWILRCFLCRVFGLEVVL